MLFYFVDRMLSEISIKDQVKIRAISSIIRSKRKRLRTTLPISIQHQKLAHK